VLREAKLGDEDVVLANEHAPLDANTALVRKWLPVGGAATRGRRLLRGLRLIDVCERRARCVEVVRVDEDLLSADARAAVRAQAGRGSALDVRRMDTGRFEVADDRRRFGFALDLRQPDQVVAQ
jgi:hypothetical protein